MLQLLVYGFLALPQRLALMLHLLVYGFLALPQRRALMLHLLAQLFALFLQRLLHCLDALAVICNLAFTSFESRLTCGQCTLALQDLEFVIEN